MEFDKSYFQGEEREGFFVEEKMKRAWAAQIEVIKEVERICMKHGLSYYAAYGTLLGAVRHKGFIPWDDDTDIFMMRDDYETFCGLVQKEAAKGYAILNIYTEKDYDQVFSRIVNSRTISFSEERLQKYHGCPYAVGVDIFPLDFLPRDEEEAQLQRDLYEFVLKVKIRVAKNEEVDDSLFTQIENLCKVKINRNEPILRQLLILIDRLSSLYHRDECDQVAIMHSNINGYTGKMKLEWFQEPIRIPFENTDIWVPQNYDQCLRAIYGDNYMTPRQYKAHDYPFYKKQDKIIQAAVEKNLKKNQEVTLNAGI